MKEKIIIDSVSVEKTLNRLSHEILENTKNSEEIVLIGIHKRGVPIAKRLKNKIKSINGIELKTGAIDITFHRDDYRERLSVPEVKGSDIPFNLIYKMNLKNIAAAENNIPYNK